MILDTNALSAIADGDRAIEPILREARSIAIPVVVLGEYLYGIRQSRERERYERWLQEIVASCRVLLIDEETASEYAAVRSELKQRGSPIPENDVWIAAIARQNRVSVISRHVHYDRVPRLKRVSW